MIDSMMEAFQLIGKMKRIQNTEREFEEFQQPDDPLLTSAVVGMSGGDVEPVETLQEKYGKPRGSDLEEAAFRLSECRSIVFIVGAGVSVESGVPTDKKWEIDGKCHSGQMMTHEEIARSNIMTSYPLEFWQKQHYTLMNMARCRPNRTHYAIAELYNYWRHIGRIAAVITQNIDNYDREVLGPDAEVYEVHGNLTYMRCMTGCCDVLFPAPETDEPIDRIPMCPSCEGLARPHILLFDESCDEKWYKSTSAEQAAANADCIIVLGTQLKTGLANRVVREACKRPNTLVIEVNVEPVIAYGQVLVFSNTCEDVVPSLVSMAVQQAG